MSDGQPIDDPNETPLIKQLRTALAEQAKSLEAMQSELTSLRRPALFEEAGVPKEGPGVSFFRQHYNGDLTVEAIQAAAREAQLIAPPPPATPVDEQQLLDQAAQATAGGQLPRPTPGPGQAAQAAELKKVASEGGAQALTDRLRALRVDLYDD